MINLRPLHYTHYAMLYSQNGDRIVTTDSVTSVRLYVKQFCILDHFKECSFRKGNLCKCTRNKYCFGGSTVIMLFYLLTDINTG